MKHHLRRIQLLFSVAFLVGIFWQSADAQTQSYHEPEVPPSGGIVVRAGTVDSVLLEPTRLSQAVMLRICSGPLKGSVVKASYSRNGWIFLDIKNIRTPYGTNVWMPICKCSDWQSDVDVPRVQVDRTEWSAVQKGGIAAAGTVFHLRILAPVQFDAPHDRTMDLASTAN